MRRVVMTLAALLIVAGCSGKASSGGSGPAGGDPTTPAAVEQASVTDSIPGPEGSGPESPQAPSKQPSISVASLPIGGGAPDQVGGVQCQQVFLTNVSDHVPAGVQITVSGVRLDPDGVFSIVDSGCSGSDHACVGWSWTGDSLSTSCLVAAKQNDGPSAQPGDTVTLNLTADVTCADDSTCRQLQPLLVGSDGGAGSLGGSTLAFTVQSAADSSSDGNG